MSARALADAAAEAPECALAALGTTRTGLTSDEWKQRLERYGHNVLVEHRVTVGGVLRRQLRNPLLILLAGAAAISGATGDPADAVIIGLILALSVGLGFTNEYRAEVAATALHASIHHQTVAWRDGTRVAVDVADLVPGDVVELSVGAHRARRSPAARSHPVGMRRSGAHR